jgi:hypothetical protein
VVNAAKRRGNESKYYLNEMINGSSNPPVVPEMLYLLTRASVGDKPVKKNGASVENVLYMS